MATKQLPFPHWLVWDHPAMIMVNGQVHRTICYLTIAYWRSGCIPLPVEDAALARLAHVPSQHMQPVKSQVQAILSKILPAIDKAYAKAEEKRQTRVIAAERARAGRKPPKRVMETLSQANKSEISLPVINARASAPNISETSWPQAAQITPPQIVSDSRARKGNGASSRFTD